MNPNRRPPKSQGPISSVRRRIHPAIRAKIDRAIIEYDPPLLRDVMLHFHVASYGVSESAFYRYAARLRERPSFTETSELASVVGPKPIDCIARLIDVELIRIMSDGPSQRKLEEHGDPFAIDDADLQRIHRLALIRNHITRSEQTMMRARRTEQERLSRPDPNRPASPTPPEATSHSSPPIPEPYAS